MNISQDAMKLYENYKVQAMLELEGKTSYNWNLIKYHLKKIAIIWANYENYKINPISLTNVQIKELDICDLLTYYMIAKTIYDMNTNKATKEKLECFIKNLQNEAQSSSYDKKCVFAKNVKDYETALNFVLNFYVEPIYIKYCFFQHWEDVNLGLINNLDLKECIFFEKNIRSVHCFGYKLRNELSEEKTL